MEKPPIYANFIFRLTAFWFDQLLVSIIPLILFFMLVGNSKVTSDFFIGILWILWELIFLQWVLYWLYLIITYLLFRASLGKILTGLSIEKEDGSKQNLKDALLRFPVGYTISHLAFSVGFLWMIKDPKKKTLHDHFSGTIVVKKNSSLPIFILLPILLMLVIFLIYSSIQTGIAINIWSQIYTELNQLFQNINLSSFKQ